MSIKLVIEKLYIAYFSSTDSDKSIKVLKDKFEIFKKMSGGGNRFNLDWDDKYPCVEDNNQTAIFDYHYIYHLAWASRIIAQNVPEFHTDISSSLHFSSLVSAFLPVKFYDYRMVDLNLTNLTCESVDLIFLPFENDSIKSLSCMHVVEHVGLGRYGDPLDPNGDLKAIKELIRVLSPGGTLLFVVPIAGIPRIQFNAHRIYSYDQILGYFSQLELKEFALIPNIPEDAGLVRNATRELAMVQTYGCGCFHFVK